MARTSALLSRAWASSRASQRAFSTSRPAGREIRDAYILSGSRTPTGVFGGSFASVPAPTLGSHAIRSALEKAPNAREHITAVYMGQVLQAGSGQSPARQASIGAGLSTAVEATTINKVCASGLKAVSLAAQAIQLGETNAMVAGGMENMTRVPYFLPRATLQPTFGDQKLADGLIGDGLWDVYNQIHMGNCAENTVKKMSISREAQDAYAISSYERAQAAWKAGHFADEVVPVTIKDRRGKETVVKEDEGYNKLKLEKVPTLKPAFDRSGAGSVTAANSSSFNDGASAIVLGSADLAREAADSSRILARIVATADAAIDPIDFPIAPAKVVSKLLESTGLKTSDISVWEFNEAFAAVILANAKLLSLEGEADAARVNPRGGAIALGHALGSSGSRILITLLHQLEVGQYGVAAICNGGGAATGVLVQRVGKSDI